MWVKHGEFDELFFHARSPRFLQDQADEQTRPRSSLGCRGPLPTLDLALTQAVALGRLDEAVHFLLARAVWGRVKVPQNPLEVLRSGDEDLALLTAQGADPSRCALWHMLLAWELADGGNRGAAREMLRRLLHAPLPQFEGRRGTQAVTLFANVWDIDAYTAGDLLRLLDDNDRTDLCRQFLDAGKIDAALTVAKGFRLFHVQQIERLWEIAQAMVAAGRQPELAAVADLAAAAADRIEPRDTWHADGIAQLGGIQALAGNADAARASFDAALRLAQAADRSDELRALTKLVAAQATAGLVDAAVATTALLLPPGASSHGYDEDDQGAALEACALAHARGGQVGEAIDELMRMSGTYTYLRRATRLVVEALTQTGPYELALEVAQRRLPPQDRGAILAALVEVLTAQESIGVAVRLAGTIEDAYWHARALIALSHNAHGRSAVAARVPVAIERVTAPKERASLLAHYAATLGVADREHLFLAARDLVDAIPEGERWRALAELAARQAQSGMDTSRTTYAQARDLILAEDEDDPWEDSRELWQLGDHQARHGDASGARETFAQVLTARTIDAHQGIKVTSLLGIAVTQARSGDAAGAARTAAAAASAIDDLPTEAQAEIEPYYVRTLIEAGDLDTSEQTIYSVLNRIGTNPMWDAADAATDAASAAIPIAERLIGTQDTGRAVRLLATVAERVGPILGQRMAGSANLAALATAQADAGDVAGATATAHMDETQQALGPALVAIARHLTRTGDTASAVQTIKGVTPAQWRAPALCAVAVALGEREQRAPAVEMFGEAVRAAEEVRSPDERVRLLVQIAAAQAAAGLTPGALRTLLAAVDAAIEVSVDNTQGLLLGRIAREQAALGDIAAARDTIRRIRNWVLAAEATYWTAVHTPAARGGSLDEAIEMIEGLEFSLWRAAGFVTLSQIKSIRGDTDAARFDAEAQAMFGRTPEGEPRDQLREIVIEAALSTKDYSLAAATVHTMTLERSAKLVQLAAKFQERRQNDALLSLLPEGAKDLGSAYMLCAIVASAYPELAGTIATEVAAMHTGAEALQQRRRASAHAMEAYAEDEDEDNDRDEDDDDDPAGRDPLAGVPLSARVEAALQDATSCRPGHTVQTRHLLLSLVHADAYADWNRIFDFRDPDGLLTADVADPDLGTGGRWGEALLTVTCAEALRLAARIATEYNLLPMPPGVLALGLLADPRSGAARCLGVSTEAEHMRLIDLVQQDVLNSGLVNFDVSPAEAPPAPPLDVEATSFAAECPGSDHQWERAEPPAPPNGGLISKIYCGACGVGHEILVRQTGPSTLETQLTIFPATGTHVISRRVVRWSFMSWEEANTASEERGLQVIRLQPVLLGMPIGN
jgi:hypothetical protein